MIVVVTPIFFRLWMKNKFSGICFWPFIILKTPELKKDLVFMNHERIHLRQQVELLVLPFYLWYGVEFLLKWTKLKNAHKAYHKIGFELEAYENEQNPDYLKERKFFGFLKYL